MLPTGETPTQCFQCGQQICGHCSSTAHVSASASADNLGATPPPDVTGANGPQSHGRKQCPSCLEPFRLTEPHLDFARVWSLLDDGRASAHNTGAAQTALGGMYTVGEGVEADETEALVWYRKAAERGHPPAQQVIGIAMLEGGLQGAPTDEGRQQELADAVLEQAVSWIKLAASSGYFPAQAMLGLMYRRGGAAVDCDASQAALWYLAAADQGAGTFSLSIFFLSACQAPCTAARNTTPGAPSSLVC